MVVLFSQSSVTESWSRLVGLVDSSSEYGRGHRQLIPTLEILAAAHTLLGNYAKQRGLLERSLAIMERARVVAAL